MDLQLPLLPPRSYFTVVLSYFNYHLVFVIFVLSGVVYGESKVKAVFEMEKLEL